MQDVDQMFGRLASYITHNLTVAQDLNDFVTGMRHFLVNLNRSHEKQAVVRRMDSIRDWNAFLFPLLRAGRYITGIGGPAAPKVFEFQRRSFLPSLHPLRAEGGINDVVLRCYVVYAFTSFA